jgi:hypothetical protein
MLLYDMAAGSFAAQIEQFCWKGGDTKYIDYSGASRATLNPVCACFANNE